MFKSFFPVHAVTVQFTLPYKSLIKSREIYSTMAETVQRVLNFAAGPAKLPEEVSRTYFAPFLVFSAHTHFPRYPVYHFCRRLYIAYHICLFLDIEIWPCDVS